MNIKIEPKNTHKIAIASVLMFTSSPVFAATGTIPWTGYLVIVVTISLLTAFILIKRNKREEETAVKILFGGMYFWAATFIQLTLLSLVYYIDNK